MASRTRQQLGQLGLFRPETKWVRPTELPDLRGRPLVCLDTENHDIGLAEKRGPGWAFGPDGGYICGVAFASEGIRGYLPIRHPDSECFPRTRVLEWVRDLARSGTRIIFHKALYDVGWLDTEGLRYLGERICPDGEHTEDTLAACVMRDENEYSYDLDECAKRAGLPGKSTDTLREAVRAFGGNVKNPRASISMLPAEYAGPYAEDDADITYQLWCQTEPVLRAQEVWDAYRTEMDLISMVVEMRRRGIRIDTDHAEKTAADFRLSSQAALREIGNLLELRRPATMEEVRSPVQMEKWFVREKIAFPRTAKSDIGSFQKEWMEKHQHPLPRACALADQYEEAASKFVENYLLSYVRRGRIHGEINQYKSDQGGTRSHRFSYSEPPLQQMPTPDKDRHEDLPHEPDDNPKLWRGQGELVWESAFGRRIRQSFQPEEGELWLAADYSQQEPRLTVHFASKVGALGAETAVQRYLDNPRTDYHSMVAEMTGLLRPIAKILNLAMTYGKGERSTAEELGISLDAARELIKSYHERLPFIKSLESKAKNLASSRGYIRLIDGARIHYPQWEGGWVEWEERKAAEAAGKRLEPTDLERARERAADPEHPWSKTRLRRADTRKALNNLIQGSAARQTKRAMRAMWQEGILPLIQMHDEVGCSVADETTVIRIGEIMRDTTPLVVPTVVDLEVGPTWGQAKMSWVEAARQYLRVAA